MPSTGAADRDRQVAPTLGLVGGEDVEQHLLEVVEERGGDRPFDHEVADLRVVPGERSQRLVPVRVGEEAHVHHDVGVERQPVLVAEALDRDLELRRALVLEHGDEPLLQLVDVELGGVDHQVGVLLDRVQRRPLVLDRLQQPAGLVGSADACGAMKS